ncbi:glycosyltransferase family 2 protein [Alphaproteobacteria bacterium]|nr:glycosyltransferase family 2 protein [Alphaproteobacteria bacterium]
MLNILIPLGASSKFFEGADYPYPKPLVEIDGKPMIQHVIENLQSISGEKRFIFILREEDCTRYHLDATLRLLAGEGVIIIKLQCETKGAACSALLAIHFIANDQPLIIANGDQLFDINIDEYFKRFQDDKIDAGCLSFESVHPRWSYIRLENDHIVEAAEKRPLSKMAIAGFYYFAKGLDFVEASKKMIRKDANVNGQFFIAPVLNELVLENCLMKTYVIHNETYHSFYSPQRIKEYETMRSRC